MNDSDAAIIQMIQILHAFNCKTVCQINTFCAGFYKPLFDPFPIGKKSCRCKYFISVNVFFTDIVVRV